MRNDSGQTAPSTDYGERDATSNSGRRHDYDVQSMETDLSGPRSHAAKNPIPAPTVTVRSEFPTLSRSRVQQSLTCVVTIEVPEGKWQADPEDLRLVSSGPALPEEVNGSVKSPTGSRPRKLSIDQPEQSQLEEITEELRMRVDNWHGLEFSRYVFLGWLDD